MIIILQNENLCEEESKKKFKYRGVDELKFMNDEYLSKNIFIIYI